MVSSEGLQGVRNMLLETGVRNSYCGSGVASLSSAICEMIGNIPNKLSEPAKVISSLTAEDKAWFLLLA